MNQVGMCHQPYTLPTNSDQTWEEVWESLSEQHATPGIPRSTSRSSDEENLTDEVLTEALTDEVMTESGESAADLVGKFPVAPHGRCPHRQYWDRLRGKRGHSYFVCRVCGIGWRQQTKVSKYQHAPTGPRAQYLRRHAGRCA